MAKHYILVRHKITDYAQWKPSFDEHGSVRKEASSKGGYILRNVDDPNEVMILLEVEDLMKVRQLLQSEDLKEAMQRSGVVEQPDVYILEEADQPPA
ncbi:MAG: cyclase [Anaerolineae bacterium]|nr:cyclase [Anaerolineae bacterium]